MALLNFLLFRRNTSNQGLRVPLHIIEVLVMLVVATLDENVSVLIQNLDPPVILARSLVGVVGEEDSYPW